MSIYLKVFSTFLLYLCISFSVKSQNRIWWVATNGNNGNPGTFASPLATIQQGMNSAASDDTAIIKPGTYIELITLPASKRMIVGSQYILNYDSSYINSTILQGNGTAIPTNQSLIANNFILAPIKIDLVGITIKNVKGKIFNTRNLHLRKVTIKNNSEGSFSNASSITYGSLDSCLITDNVSSNFTIQNTTLKNSLVQNTSNGIYSMLDLELFGNIENCQFINNGAGVFVVYLISTGNRIINNLFIRNNGTALTTFNGGTGSSSDSILIVNNTFFGNTNGYAPPVPSSPSRKILLYNNIFANHRENDLRLNSNSSTAPKHLIVLKNNLFNNNFTSLAAIPNINSYDTLGSINNFGGQPNFIDTTAINFRLANSSPAIGKGTLSLTVAYDLAGLTRPAPAGSMPDIGAYESLLGSNASGTQIVSVKPGNKRDTINWIHLPDVSNIRKFKLYRSTSPNASILIADSLPTAASTYIDLNLKNDTTYYYRLQAVELNGNELSFSTEKSATPINKAPVTVPLSNEYMQVGRNLLSKSFSSSGAYDPDGSIDSTVWFLNGTRIAAGTNVQFKIPQGTNTISYKIYDNDGTTSTALCTRTYFAASVTTNNNITTGLSAFNSNNIFYTDLVGTPQVIRLDSLLNVNYDGGPSSTGVNNNIISSPSITPDSIMFIANGSSLDAFRITGVPYFGSSASLGGTVQVLPTIDTLLKRVYLGISNGTWFSLGYGTQTPSIKWTYFAGDQTSGFSSPGVITSGRRLVYTTTSGVIKGFELDSIISASPVPKWNFATGKLVKKALAIDADGNIIITDDLGTIHKYKLENSGAVTEVWEKTLSAGKFNTSVVIDGLNNYYAGTDDGKMVKLFPATGDTVWTYSSGSVVTTTPSLSDYNTVYFGTQAGDIYCINTNDGVRQWSFKLDLASVINGHMLHIAGATYFTTATSKKIYELWDKPDDVNFTYKSTSVNSTGSTNEPSWSGFQGDFRRSGQSKYVTYRFIGNGNWSLSTNWQNGVAPSLNILRGYKIVIDPAGNGECIIDGPISLNPGSSLVVAPGKKIVIR